MSKEMGEEPQHWGQAHVIGGSVHALVGKAQAPLCVRRCLNSGKTVIRERKGQPCCDADYSQYAMLLEHFNVQVV